MVASFFVRSIITGLALCVFEDGGVKAPVALDSFNDTSCQWYFYSDGLHLLNSMNGLALDINGPYTEGSQITIDYIDYVNSTTNGQSWSYDASSGYLQNGLGFVATIYDPSLPSPNSVLLTKPQGLDSQKFELVTIQAAASKTPKDKM